MVIGYWVSWVSWAGGRHDARRVTGDATLSQTPTRRHVWEAIREQVDGGDASLGKGRTQSTQGVCGALRLQPADPGAGVADGCLGGLLRRQLPAVDRARERHQVEARRAGQALEGATELSLGEGWGIIV